MRVRISRIDPSLPLPAYGSAGAAGFDLAARIDVVVAPHSLARIPTNVIVQVPDDHVLVVSLRSSTPGRTGLIAPHGVGVIDRDYCGPEDEVQILVYNPSPAPVTVTRGQRIAQGMVLPVARAEWDETAVAAGLSRGGFGSTG